MALRTSAARRSQRGESVPRVKAVRVRYVGPDTNGVTLPDGTHFPTGEAVAVPVELAQRLLDQPTFTTAEGD